MTEAEFGVTIGCCPSDYHLAEGTVASVRYFYGDVPICLIIDGKVDTRHFRKDGNLTILDRGNVSDPFLREKSFGWGFNKLISFWEAPFRTFLYLDADEIAWGDLRPRLNFSQYDVITPYATDEYEDSHISHNWFEVEGIAKIDPDFTYRKQPLFCAGVLAGRKGGLPLNEYKRAYELMERNPGVFKFGDQGLTNYMIFRAAQKGAARVGREPFQVIVHEHKRKDFEGRFNIEKLKDVPTKEACVIHWAGYTKPYTTNPDFSPELMTHFRRTFAEEWRVIPAFLQRWRMGWIDFWAWSYPHFLIKWRRRFGKLLKILKIAE